MMIVQVYLYGEFRKVASSPTFPLEVEDGLTVKGLMERVKLPDTVYRMALVNNIRVRENAVLKNGDEVHIFQPIGGG